MIKRKHLTFYVFSKHNYSTFLLIRYEEQIYIRYGTVYSHKSSYPLVKVAEIWRHPDFKKDDGELINDIAILILEQNIKPTEDVGYAKLPTSNFNDRRTVIVYGWSGEDFCEPCNPILRKAEMIARPSKQCVELEKAECPSVRNCKIMCATGKFWGSAVGDSGGPVFLPDKTLVGIISSRLNLFSFESPPWEEGKFVKVFHRLRFINLKEKYVVKNLKPKSLKRKKI